MALRGNLADLVAVTTAVEGYVTYGTNANTAKKDERAWQMWVVVCKQQGTSPLRTAADARDRPERNAHLLAALLMHAFSVCKPRHPQQLFIKPRSALAYPLAIVRIFARWGVVMPSYKSLVAALNGLLRAYVVYHGPQSLAPRRAEPMKFSMVRDINGIPPGARVLRGGWGDAIWDVFSFRRLNLVLIVTAFRLGEIVSHASGEIMYLTFASVTWRIGGVLVTCPTVQQLQALRPGLDCALVAPPRSKPDQWGEIHCPFPVTLTFGDEPENAAAALRDLELRTPVAGTQRQSTPLFCDPARQPYTHGRLDGLLRAALVFLYGEAVAAVFSWHSYRSGLATALHAAGVSGERIQLICRWMCAESLHVYRRMGTAEHEALIRRAATTNIDVVQAINVPAVAGDAGFAQLAAELQHTRGRDAGRAYDNAHKAALADAPETKSQAHPVRPASQALPDVPRCATPPAAPARLVDLACAPEAGAAREVRAANGLVLVERGPM